MRERIITQSIESLRREGLKFSVDTIAQSLNISKKTIYKYFNDKQSLAIAIYERYYTDAYAQIKELAEDNSQSARCRLLWQYFDAKQMTSSEIFNKYNLNSALRLFTEEQNEKLFKVIYTALGGSSQRDEQTLRIIVDGAFEKLCKEKLSAEEVINYLVKALI